MSILFTWKMDDKKAEEKTEKESSHRGNTVKSWTWVDLTGKRAQVKLRTDTLFVSVNGNQVSPKLKSAPTRIEMKFDVAGDSYCITGDKGRTGKGMCFSLTVNGSDSGVVESGDL